MSNQIPVKLPSADNAPRAEEAIISYWDRNNTFKRSVEERPEDNRYVFYEGPPTANGRPGVHHVIARLCKDLVCRYKTMQGYRVVRKAGWDTHGLPVEIHEKPREYAVRSMKCKTDKVILQKYYKPEKFKPIKKID